MLYECTYHLHCWLTVCNLGGFGDVIDGWVPPVQPSTEPCCLPRDHLFYGLPTGSALCYRGKNSMTQDHKWDPPIVCSSKCLPPPPYYLCSLVPMCSAPPTLPTLLPLADYALSSLYNVPSPPLSLPPSLPFSHVQDSMINTLFISPSCSPIPMPRPPIPPCVFKLMS